MKLFKVLSLLVILLLLSTISYFLYQALKVRTVVSNVSPTSQVSTTTDESVTKNGIIENKLTPREQTSEQSILLEKAEISGGGFAVVREISSDNTGLILGYSEFIVDTTLNLEIPVNRTLNTGEKLEVILYKDTDFNAIFEENIDRPLEGTVTFVEIK